MSRVSIIFSAKPGPHQVWFFEFYKLLQDIQWDCMYEYDRRGMAKMVVSIEHCCISIFCWRDSIHHHFVSLNSFQDYRHWYTPYPVDFLSCKFADIIEHNIYFSFLVDASWEGEQWVLAGGGGRSVHHFTAVVARGECGVGDSSPSGTCGFGYLSGVSKRLTGSWGQSGSDSVLLIRVHNPIECNSESPKKSVKISKKICEKWVYQV